MTTYLESNMPNPKQDAEVLKKFSLSKMLEPEFSESYRGKDIRFPNLSMGLEALGSLLNLLDPTGMVGGPAGLTYGSAVDKYAKAVKGAKGGAQATSKALEEGEHVIRGVEQVAPGLIGSLKDVIAKTPEGGKFQQIDKIIDVGKWDDPQRVYNALLHEFEHGKQSWIRGGDANFWKEAPYWESLAEVGAKKSSGFQGITPYVGAREELHNMLLKAYKEHPELFNRPSGAVFIPENILDRRIANKDYLDYTPLAEKGLEGARTDKELYAKLSDIINRAEASSFADVLGRIPRNIASKRGESVLIRPSGKPYDPSLFKSGFKSGDIKDAYRTEKARNFTSSVRTGKTGGGMEVSTNIKSKPDLGNYVEYIDPKTGNKTFVDLSNTEDTIVKKIISGKW